MVHTAGALAVNQACLQSSCMLLFASVCFIINNGNWHGLKQETKPAEPKCAFVLISADSGQLYYSGSWPLMMLNAGLPVHLQPW